MRPITGLWLLSASILLVADSAPQAGTSFFEEMRLFGEIVGHIHNYYFEALPSDTLMRSGVDGLFYALDPASEYSFTGEEDGRKRGNTFQRLKEDFGTFQQIAKTINDSAFYAVSPDTLVRFGIAGMMQVLDPYSVFMEKRNLDNFLINTRGKYGGLGFRIQVIRPDSAIAVVELLHDQTPAALAGVKSGDLIIAIDDSSTRRMSASDAADLMRGEPGTPVTLTLLRAGRDEPLKIRIVRKVVQINSVPYYTLFPDSTGYIELNSFQQHCSREVRHALVELENQGMRRLIFDLRNNGGGYLQEAVYVADLFLPKKRLVVFTAGRAFADTSKYFTKEDPLFEGEMVVLVNRSSASASEIVAGAIQDWDRGLVIGMPTVGKGSVQQTIPLKSDDKAELKLTMAAYFIPSGRSIDKRMRKDSTLVSPPEVAFYTRVRGRIVHGGGGITPDIAVDEWKRTPLLNQLEGLRTLDNQFFHFARQYPVVHPELTLDFRAGDKVLNTFRDSAAARRFEYLSPLEARLNILREKSAGEEGYKKLAKDIEKLKEQIDEIEEKHWQKDTATIERKLTYSILEKAFGIQAAEAYLVTIHPQVLKARQVLADPLAYEKWLARPEVGVPDSESVAADEKTNAAPRQAEGRAAAGAEAASADTALALKPPSSPDPAAPSATSGGDSLAVALDRIVYREFFPDSTGYIALSSLAPHSSRQVRRALAELESRGVQRLILDLRDDGEGTLKEALALADLFLPADRLAVFAAGRVPADTSKYFTRDKALFDGKLLVLVNHNTAAAAEMVAGAIQDWDRGLVVGAPTLGKGSVQKTLPIAGGVEVKLTTAAYFSPSGRSIDKRMRKDSTLVPAPEQSFYTLRHGRLVHPGGITPDIEAAKRQATPLYRQLEADSSFVLFALQYPVHTPLFRADDETLNAFRRFLAQRGFDYVSPLETRLRALEELSVREETQEKLGKYIKRLKGKIDAIEEKHWEKSAGAIKERLSYEILAHNLGAGAARTYRVAVDSVLLQARRIIADPLAYEAWLNKPEIGLSRADTVAELAGEKLQSAAEH